MIWRLIPGPIRRAVSWLAGALMFGLFMRHIGRRDERKTSQIKTLQQEVKAHDRINKADTGIGATDADRIKRLQDMADKWSD